MKKKIGPILIGFFAAVLFLVGEDGLATSAHQFILFGIRVAAAAGLTSINADTTAAQLIVVDTAGTDVGVATTGGTTTISVPSASGTNRGAVTTGAQTLAGVKTFSSQPILSTLSASLPVVTDGSKGLVSVSYATFLASLGAAPTASPTFTGTVTLPSGSVTSSAWDTGTSTLTVNGVAFSGKLTSTGFVEEWTGHVQTAGNVTYWVIPYSALGRKVVSVRFACYTSGTITAKLQIDGVDITTCTGISVTSTPGSTTCDTGSTSTLAANSILTIVGSSNSSCLDLAYDVKTTRQ